VTAVRTFKHPVIHGLHTDLYRPDAQMRQSLNDCGINGIRARGYAYGGNLSSSQHLLQRLEQSVLVRDGKGGERAAEKCHFHWPVTGTLTPGTDLGVDCFSCRQFTR
jgi:hypothetical protein